MHGIEEDEKTKKKEMSERAKRTEYIV